MTKFMTRRPVLAGVLLTLLHGPLDIAFAWFVLKFWARLWPTGGWLSTELVRWGLVVLLSAGIACWLAFLRRRSGLSAWPVCWLVALMPVVIVAESIVLIFVLVPPIWGWASLMGSITNPGWWNGWLTATEPWSATVGVLLGTLAAQILAERKLRSGQWPQIAADGQPGPTFLARRPLFTASLLLAPCFFYVRALHEIQFNTLTMAQTPSPIVLAVLISLTAFCAAYAVTKSQQQIRPDAARLDYRLPLLGSIVALAYLLLALAISHPRNLPYLYANDHKMLGLAIATAIICAGVGMKLGVMAALRRTPA